MVSMTIQRFSRYAETSFARLCAEAGAVCNQSQEDENGWDFLVEFPPADAPGPADTHPPIRTSFVQVKSTRTRRPACTIKLSNALKAAQSREPWFVVLMFETQSEPEIYAVHVWQGLMEKWLAEVRRARIEEAALHKRRITIHFDKDDLHTADLLTWMKTEIDAVLPEYSNAKRAINETIGFENGHAAGSLTIDGATTDQIFNEFLGLGSGLPLSKFTASWTRFGFTDKQPFVDAAQATLYVTPEPAGDCELRMRGPRSGQSMQVQAKVYTLGMPFLPKSQQRSRVAAPGFEIIVGTDEDSKFTAKLDINSQVPLGEVRRFAAVMTWLRDGPIDLQIWALGRRVMGSVLTGDTGPMRHDWRKILDVVDTLSSLSSSPADPPSLRVMDILMHTRELYLMHQVVTASNIQLEFAPFEEGPNRFDRVLYYSTAQFSNLTAFALIERPLRKAVELNDGRRQLEFGVPILLENWIISDAGPPQLAMIDSDYRHHVEVSDRDRLLELGNIDTFIRSLGQETNAEPP